MKGRASRWAPALFIACATTTTRLPRALGEPVPAPAQAASPPAASPPPDGATPPPKTLVRAPGAPPRTSIDEPIGPGSESQYFFLHDDNYFALQTNGGWPARVKFQISLRFDMLSLGDRNNLGLNFAYTQKSFWDLFALDRSSPFVESNYKPELFVSYRPSRLVRYREAQLGIQHESNGLGETGAVNQVADTRGWNSIFLEGRWGITRAKPSGDTWFYLTPGLRVWYPFVYSPSDLIGALGYFYAFLDVDLRIPEFPQVSRISMHLKVQRHGLLANFYYPLLPFLSGGRIRAWIFLQLFHGEAERLITYNETVTHMYAGIGFQ